MTWLSILGQNHWSVVWRTRYGGARRNTGKPVSKLLQQAGAELTPSFINLLQGMF